MTDQQIEERLLKLVDKATDKRKHGLDSDLVNGVKSICKQSDSNVTTAFRLLISKLREKHSQTRLLSLLICDELFNRSKVFRRLVLQDFTRFLEYTVGFRKENPLPPPAAAASNLRSTALQVVEKWNATFGSKYKQIALGIDYLKNVLKYTFPEAQTRQAQEAAERREQEARAQAIARDKFEKFAEDYTASSAEWKNNLQQLLECHALLQDAAAEAQRYHTAVDAQQQPPALDDDTAEHDAADDADIDALFDDTTVPPYGSEAAVQAAGNDAAVQAAGSDAAVQAAGNDAAVQAAGNDAAVQPDAVAVGATCAGKADEEMQWEEVPVEQQAAPALPEDPYDPALVDTTRELVATLKKRVLPEIQEGLKVLSKVDLSGESRQRQSLRDRLLRECIQLKNSISHTLEHHQTMEEALNLPSNLVWSDEQDGGKPAAAAALNRAGHEYSDLNEAAAARQPPGVQLHNPYDHIKHPAAPKKRELDACDAAASGGMQQSKRRETHASTRSSLPADVKTQLLAKAPQLPAGSLLHYWEGGGQHLADHRQLDIHNHWGPVDRDAALSATTQEQLFGHVASYYRPHTGKKAGPSSSAPSSCAAAALSSGGDSPAHGSCRYPSSTTSAPRDSGNKLLLTNLAAATGSHNDDAGSRRATRAAERAYNEAVIGGGANSDEALARRLQQGEATQQGEGGAATKSRPPRTSTRQRLERKLLSRRALSVTHKELSTTEDEIHRDKYMGW